MSKIMVIEEDSAMRLLISEWLTGEGYDVGSLLQRGDAFEGVADPAVDVVVLDLPHPRSQSTKTARTVQAVHAAYRQATVVGISTQMSRSLSGDSEVARALGVSHLLAKPCSRRELLDAVAAALAA